MKKTAGMTNPVEQNTPRETIQELSPAEIENECLRKALAEEQIKTEALSRRCIRLGTALDAVLRAEDNRIEKEIIDLVNEHSDQRKAEEIARKRRMANARKAARAYKKACTRNSVALGLSMVICFLSAMLGFAGIINPAIGAVIACISFIAFGWSLNTCVTLIGRCK